MAKRISKSLKGTTALVQGSSLKTYQDFGLSGFSMTPTITSTPTQTIMLDTLSGNSSVTNLNNLSAFNDTVGSLANGVPTLAGEKRQLVPNFSLESVMIGQPEELDLTSIFVDGVKVTVSASSQDLSAGLVNRYLGATALKDERFNGTILVFDGYPVNPVVYSGSKEKSTPLLGTFSAGTEDHFPGEATISDVLDTKAPQCRGFIDGPTQSLTMLVATGSFFALDIENSPFIDAVEKTLTYEGLTDSSIMSSFPLAQTGSIHNEALLPHERFAAGGFTYDISQYGPDAFGTDSITFGGWMK